MYADVILYTAYSAFMIEPENGRRHGMQREPKLSSFLFWMNLQKINNLFAKNLLRFSGRVTLRLCINCIYIVPLYINPNVL